MPVIEVHLIEGYADDDRQRLGRALTRACQSVVPAPDDAVTVMIHEMGKASYLRGGTMRTPAPALPDPVALVQGYLQAMEARDLEAARACLGAGFVMRFPGAAPMTGLEELLEWAAPRYRSIAKSIAAFDQSQTRNGPVVHCHGTLSGIWPDGTPFDGIRFIDRFEITQGLITRQDVWNDLAEHRRG